MVGFAWWGLGSPGSAGDPRNKAEAAVKFNCRPSVLGFEISA